ncbi:MAG: secretin N-terminal domain-containing protein [Rugosibacter sp.]|nr:secretin N-terminal domain-containing protein [Rugosibacter sp.]
MKLKTIIPWGVVLVSLAACSSAYPPRDTSTLDRINNQLKQATVPREKAAPLPEAVSSSLLPPLRSPVPRASDKQLEQRFDLVVTNAPINQVLMGIVSGTRYSIMVKPKSAIPAAPGGVAVAASASTGLMDNVTVNLKDVTVFEALDAIREVYGYDYTLDGNRIYVQQPELQTRLYQVNYIIGQRRGVSDLQVIGGASVGSSNSGSGSNTGSSSSSSDSGTTSSSYGSVQASALSTISKSDIWGEVEDTLRTTLGCQIPKSIPKTWGGGSTSGSSSSSSSSNSNSASRADVSYVGDTQSGERQRGVDGCTDGRAMNINQMSGTIVVRGMPNEHRMIGKMLRSMQLNIERQVIIEAKIIDVELNSESQQGINWAGFQHNLHRYSVGANTTTIDGTNSTNGGAVNQGTSLGALLGTGMVGAAAGNAFSAGLGMAVQLRNFSALINFLQTQGHVHVLSSPRIATLNSQKAVLKVGSEEPFVTNISGGTTSITNGISNTTPPTLQYQPFFSGISLDVTPQIDDKDNITLHVHSMVNSIIEKEKISQPTAGAVRVPFAVNTISETDSVVKTRDGQVVVIGGLMTERAEDSRSKVPGAGDVPGAGALFSKGGQRAIKRELVILLRPTVVKNDSAWVDDISAVQGRIESLGASTPLPSNRQ